MFRLQERASVKVKARKTHVAFKRKVGSLKPEPYKHITVCLYRNSREKIVYIYIVLTGPTGSVIWEMHTPRATPIQPRECHRRRLALRQLRERRVCRRAPSPEFVVVILKARKD